MPTWNNLRMAKPIQQERLDDLASSFAECLDTFTHRGPFSEMQLRAHVKALMRRRLFPSAGEAVNDDEFADAVRDTLGHWGVGTRGAELVPVEAFRGELRKLARNLDGLDQLQIDDPALDGPKTALMVWNLLDSICLVMKNGQPVKNKVVSGTKALHHVLPKLVFPIDREYTQTFFGWHNPEFQNNPQDCFILIFVSIASLAKVINLAQLVGGAWLSSPAKILDNAIVGYCVKHGLKSESTQYQQKRARLIKAMEKRAKELGILEEVRTEANKMANALLSRSS
jgi:hypothetical protein